MNNKNLYILEDKNNKDVINFFLGVCENNIDLEIINKYNFVKYIDNGFIEGNEEIPSGNYHLIKLDLNNIKIESLKNNIKEFIQETFLETVNSENDFIELIENLNNFFSKKKSESSLKFIEDVFSLLLFINYLYENNIINNNFLENYYVESNQYLIFNIECELNIFISNKENLKIKHEENVILTDYIAVSFQLVENKQITVLKMFEILESKGLIFNDKFKMLRNVVQNLEHSLISKKTIVDFDNIEFIYYDHNDIPIIEVIDYKKCKQIIFKMCHSLSSIFEEEELRAKMIKLFKKNKFY